MYLYIILHGVVQSRPTNRSVAEALFVVEINSIEHYFSARRPRIFSQNIVQKVTHNLTLDTFIFNIKIQFLCDTLEIRILLRLFLGTVFCQKGVPLRTRFFNF